MRQNKIKANLKRYLFNFKKKKKLHYKYFFWKITIHWLWLLEQNCPHSNLKAVLKAVLITHLQIFIKIKGISIFRIPCLHIPSFQIPPKPFQVYAFKFYFEILPNPKHYIWFPFLLSQISISQTLCWNPQIPLWFPFILS